MENLELHNELKDLAISTYKENSNLKPQNWAEVGSKENKKTGFNAQAFYKGDKIVIAFRGSDDITDWTDSNIEMGLNKIPAQLPDARKFYGQIKKEFPNQIIIFTGHSLGGSLSQLMSNETGCKAVTFNAFGVGSILDGQIINADNIINYGHKNDACFAMSIDNQIGKTYILNAGDGDYAQKETSQGIKTNIKPIKNHTAESLDLNTAIPYKPEKFELSISHNINYKDIDPDRIFTNEEIGKMSGDEYSKNEEFINQQLQNGKIMPNTEAESRLQAGSLVWVSDYTRDDGTEVKGYYRSKGK